MTSSTLLPTSYAEWRHCIEVDCGLEITPEFVAARLAALQNPKDHATRRFLELYGEAHHARVLGWFREAQAAVVTVG
ncbi:MAG: hypothetical protein JJT93_01345 [Gammaproteobacteria bacterium]|nr:hypothetical protein [Gammaproteobacteria bacterium]TVQ45557.1 MAG: hypothetical protein EA371_11735 [Gammaproteobacteria bacterium]